MTAVPPARNKIPTVSKGRRWLLAKRGFGRAYLWFASHGRRVPTAVGLWPCGAHRPSGPCAVGGRKRWWSAPAHLGGPARSVNHPAASPRSWSCRLSRTTTLVGWGGDAASGGDGARTLPPCAGVSRAASRGRRPGPTARGLVLSRLGVSGRTRGGQIVVSDAALVAWGM